MAAAPIDLSELSAEDAYAAIYTWLKSDEPLRELQDKSGKQEPPEAPIQLIKSLPEPSSATSGEMRLVFREVMSGHLEYFFSASDGRATMSDYARIGINALGGNEITAEEAIQLIDSPMLPSLLYPDDIFAAFAQSAGVDNPVYALDRLTNVYQYARRELGPELWVPLLDAAGEQALDDPGQWEAVYNRALDRLSKLAEQRGEKDLRDICQESQSRYESVKNESTDLQGEFEATSAAEGSPETNSSVAESGTPDAEPDPVSEFALRGALAPAYLTDALGTSTGLEEAKLGIEPDIRAISTVMMNENWEPPLAVGLFGRWGAGKSFFMNQLHRQVERLAAASREAARAGKPGPLCRRPVQISFNAWHYIDANLWASLVVRIFDSLSVALNAKTDDATKKVELVEELETYKNLRREAEERRKRAQEQLSSVQARAVNARARLQVAEQLLRAAEALGITSADQVDRMASTLQRRLGTLRALLFSPGGIARLTIIAIAITLYRFPAVFDQIQWLTNSMKDFALGLVAVIPSWQLFQNGSRLRSTAKLVTDIVDASAETIDTGNQAKDLFASRLIDPQDAMGTETRLKQELERINTEESELKERYEEIQREIHELSPRRQLSKLVEERASENSSYRRAQGLVSLIREDFSQLETTLKRLHKPQESKDPRRGAADEPGRESAADKKKGAADDYPIDRIILYIDDLDRCPADRVAEVLQAVHLLLGFEIFVVVVAVDPRWLLKSLQKSYPELLTNVLKDDQSSSATPRDYLEKIFQIPYTIPLMTGNDSLEYMEYLLKHGQTARPKIAPTPVSAALLSGESDASDQDTGDATNDLAAALSTSTPTDSELDKDDPTPDAIPATDTTVNAELDSTASDADSVLAEGIDASPATLELSALEEKLIRALGPIFRTPRAGKRFVNVYRILRVTIEPDKLQSYVELNCRSVLLLLASVLEYPEVGVYLLRKVRTSGDGELWSDFIAGLSVDKLPGLNKTAEWQLRRLQERTAGLGKMAQAPMNDLSAWAERVGRYTFGD